MRRANMAAQMFIYILGIIVVGLILLLGFKALDKLQQDKCTVQYTQFSTDLGAAMDKNKGWGISRTEDFNLPCDATEVCFVSRQSIANRELYATDTATIETFAGLYPIIYQSVKSGDNTNVFLKKPNGYERVDKFEVSAPIDLPQDEPIRCIPGSPAKIQFLGKGQTVEVVDASGN